MLLKIIILIAIILILCGKSNSQLGIFDELENNFESIAKSYDNSDANDIGEARRKNERNSLSNPYRNDISHGYQKNTYRHDWIDLKPFNENKIGRHQESTMKRSTWNSKYMTCGKKNK